MSAAISALSNANINQHNGKQAFRVIQCLHAAVVRLAGVAQNVTVWPATTDIVMDVGSDLTVISAENNAKLSHTADARVIRDILRGVYTAAFHDKKSKRAPPPVQSRWTDHDHEIETTIVPTGEGLEATVEYSEAVAKCWAVLATAPPQNVSNSRPSTIVSITRPSISPCSSRSCASCCLNYYPRTLFLDAVIDTLLNKHVSPPFCNMMLSHGLSVFLWELERIRLAAMNIDIIELYNSQANIWNNIIIDRFESYRDPDDKSSDDAAHKLYEPGYIDTMRQTFAHPFVPLLRRDQHNLDIPLISNILDTFCNVVLHLCYCRKWREKKSGLLCLESLIRFTPLTWILPKCTELTRAVLFVMRDVPREISASTIDYATQVLDLLIKRCTPRANEGLMDWDANRYYDNVIDTLLEDIMFPGSVVRKSVQRSLIKAAAVSGLGLHNLMAPRMAGIRKIITETNWPKTPILIQLGNIDGLSFCLRVQPPLVTMDPQVEAVLTHAARIAEKDEKELNSQVIFLVILIL